MNVRQEDLVYEKNRYLTEFMLYFVMRTLINGL